MDEAFMAEALAEARKADAMGEVPVGAVITLGGEVIARGFNMKESAPDPTLHAEIVAITEAARVLSAWRLEETTLYVTLEPCLMCMGALIQARVPRLVFGAYDPKAGACGSVFDFSMEKRLNHSINVTAGVLGKESKTLLKDFFVKLRNK
jgi:tRNA(adenine34) deaminase